LAREYAPGDRVIARRNDRRQEVDNGTLGTVVALDADHVHVRTDAGENRPLELPYVAEHLEHAYALTAHGAQGASVTWAGVLGRPEEFTREWAYTALSRAREETVLHIVAARPIGTRDKDANDSLSALRSREENLRALRRTMRRSEREPLAAQQLQARGSLDRRHTVARIAHEQQLDRLAVVDLQRQLAGSAAKLGRPDEAPRQPPKQARGVRLRL
jgi:hypothetical protein